MVNSKIYPFENIQWVGEIPTHFIGRCPFCGDSQRHPNKGHLYVSKKYPVYICHRCNKSGHIKDIEEILNEKTKYQFEVSQFIQIDNISSFKLKEKIQSEIKSFKFEDYDKTCLAYLRKRFKCLNDSEFISIRTFANMVSPEYVTKYFPNEPYTNVITRVWFSTILGTQFLGRDATELNNLRYKNLKIKELEDLENAFLNVKNDFISDCYMVNNFSKSKNTKSIIIAEGIFDIIPIFMKRKKYRLTDSAIYSACLGNDYSRPIKVYKNLFMSFPKFITVFADVGINYEDIKNKISKVMAGRKFNLEINYPMIKDWNEAGPIKYSKKF